MSEPEVLYIDEAVIVLNKPAGLLVHKDGNRPGDTLVDWLLSHYPELQGVGEEQTLPNGEVIDRPGIVHRLDRDTSGVIIVARTQEAYEALKEQFAERQVRKVYRAFVHGVIKGERGVIDKPIGTSRGGSGPRSSKKPHGELRDALTTYRVIERTPEATYIEVFPKTGRTHQIRVHMSSVQHPLIGDKLYAPRRPLLLGFTRLALHAFSVTFAHPITEKELTVEAPLPPDFLEGEKKLAAVAKS